MQEFHMSLLQTTAPARKWTVFRHGEAILAGFRDNRLLHGFAVLVIFAAALEAAVLGLPMDLQMVLLFSVPVLFILFVMIILGIVLEMVPQFSPS
jgi:hypothetical protein